jgi:hypothetical protein
MAMNNGILQKLETIQRDCLITNWGKLILILIRHSFMPWKPNSQVIFQEIPLGGVVKLTDPQAAYAYELAGPDSHQLTIEVPPAFSSAREASEMA